MLDIKLIRDNPDKVREGLKKRNKDAKALKQEIKNLETEFTEIEKTRSTILDNLPNIPADDVPSGKDESGNVVLREVGGKRKFDFQPKEYLEIAEKLDVIDVQRAAKV